VENDLRFREIDEKKDEYLMLHKARIEGRMKYVLHVGVGMDWIFNDPIHIHFISK